MSMQGQLSEHELRRSEYDEPYSEAWLYGSDPDVNTPDSNLYSIEYDSDVDQSIRQL